MVTAAEALLSEDLEIIKRFKRSSRIQIKCNLNILENALANRNEGKFIFEKISSNLIKNHKEKLQNSYYLIQKLQDRYIEIRPEGLDENKENRLVSEDIEFIKMVSSEVQPVFDDIDRYEVDLVRFNERNELIHNEKHVRVRVLESKKEFHLIHDTIKTEIDSIESKTGDMKKEFLQTIPVDSFCNDLSAALAEVNIACS